MTTASEMVMVKCEPDEFPNEPEEYEHFDDEFDTGIVIKQEMDKAKSTAVLSTPKSEECVLMTFDELPYTVQQLRDNTMYQCKTCSLEKGRLNVLMKHIKEKHPEIYIAPRGSAVYKCDKIECQKIFYMHSELTKHVMIKHADMGNKKKIKCILCDMTFQYNYLLKRHTLSIHMDVTPFLCDTCNRYFSSRSHLTRHFRTHEVRKYVCSKCGESFQNNYSLNFHSIKKHQAEKLFKCHLCSKKYNFDYHLDSHLKNHEQKNGFPCDECGKICKRISGLKQHMMIHLANGKQNDKSDQINTSNKVDSTKFLFKHTPEDVMKTDSEKVKNLVKTSKNDLKDNYGIVYDKDDIFEENKDLNPVSNTSRRESCDSDDIPLNLIQMKKEEFIEIEPFILPEALLGDDFSISKDGICQHCNAKFSSKILLEKHIRIVHAFKKYICLECDKKFIRKSNFFRHRRKHKEKEDMFKCDLCSKLFQYKLTLEKHMESHGTISIKCHICFQSFEDANDYRRHMLSHSTDGKLFSCKVCPKLFLEINTLKRHCSRVHNLSRAIQLLKRDDMYD